MKSHKLKLGIIGAYGGQGQRILSYVYDNIETEYVVYEYNIQKKRERLSGIKYTISTNLETLLTCDGIVISAPTSDHFYINYFIVQDYDGYIFCEKPPVETSEELKQLRLIDDTKKRRILFGFNLRYSIYRNILNGNTGYDLGELRYCSIISGHGLGYKDFYACSWRNDEKKTTKGVFETVSIHYLDIFINQFGKPESSFLCPSINVQEGRVWDNVMYSAAFKNGVLVNIFNSYVTPFIEESKMIFENGIVEIDKNSIRIYYPRDSFDSKGRYTVPPLVYEYESQLEIWNESQREIMKTFYLHIIQKSEIDVKEYNKAMDTTEYVLQI